MIVLLGSWGSIESPYLSSIVDQPDPPFLPERCYSRTQVQAKLPGLSSQVTLLRIRSMFLTQLCGLLGSVWLIDNLRPGYDSKEASMIKQVLLSA